MSFQQTTFLGASLVSFSISLGWNESTTTLNARLVEDPAQGDSFQPKLNGNEYMIGRPYLFEFGSFRFYGILQNWTESNEIEGKPLYDCVLTDPRDILDGSHVVVDSFTLAGDYDQQLFKAEMPTLFNVYDFLESEPYGSFGASQVNDAGMYWENLKLGIYGIENNYGPLRYMGVNYYLDLDSLPQPPLFYRVPGPSLSVLEMASLLCQDAGCDFYVELDTFERGNIIRFKTVSRVAQPPLGQIKQYISSKTNVTDVNKTVSANNQGLEFRNDVVSVIMVGANREDMYFISDLNFGKIKPFFGFDINGQVIVTNDLENATTVTLNSSPIYDITNDVNYQCTLLELRCAMYNMETWMMAVGQFNPGIAAVLQVDTDSLNQSISDIITELTKESTISTKILPTKKADVEFGGDVAFGEDFAIKINRVYEFVKKIADEYYGKKFAVLLPSVAHNTEPDSGEVIYEYEICDTGFVQPGASQGTTGLLQVNEAILTDDVGKFYPYCRFNQVIDKDLSGVNPENSVLQDDGNTLYTQISVEPYIVNPARGAFAAPCAIVTLQNPINDVVESSIGDLNGLKDLLGLNDTQIDKYKKMDQNNFFVKVPYAIPPKANIPTSVALALRSNRYSYGPWKTPAFNPGGKVRYERDETLTPWNFGGYGQMDDYAYAKIANAYTGMTVGETGSITEAGAPSLNVGEVLKAGGPNITGISVDISTGGVRTTYNMRTYTPKFGAYYLQGAERARRVVAQTSRNRNFQRKIIQMNSARTLQTHIQRVQFLQGTMGYAKRTGGTPHEGLVCYVSPNGSRKETTVASDIATHFVGKFRGSKSNDFSEELKRMGAIGMEGLFRPYQTDFNAPTGIMPKYTQPTVSGVGNPNVNDLNPFQQGHDINIVLKTDSAGAYDNYILQGSNEGSKDYLKPIGLKAPLVLVGWGYDTAGNPTPSSSPNKFQTDYQKKPELWKAGPVDLRWDESRGVWAAGSTIQKVRLDAPLNNEGQMVKATIYNYSDNKFQATTSQINVSTFLRGVDLPSGTRCFVVPDAGFSIVVSAEA